MVFTGFITMKIQSGKDMLCHNFSILGPSVIITNNNNSVFISCIVLSFMHQLGGYSVKLLP